MQIVDSVLQHNLAISSLIQADLETVPNFHVRLNIDSQKIALITQRSLP